MHLHALATVAARLITYQNVLMRLGQITRTAGSLTGLPRLIFLGVTQGGGHG